MQNFGVLSVGQKIDIFKDVETTTVLDLDNIITIYVVERYISPSEIKNFENNNIELGISHVDDLDILTVKISEVTASEIPFHVGNFSYDVPTPEFEDGTGYGVSLVLVDGKDGEIKSLRVIGTSASFSKHLANTIKEQKREIGTFDRERYFNKAMEHFNRCSIADVIKENKVSYISGTVE